MKEVARMLKAIHSQEDKAAALEKATAVAEKLLTVPINLDSASLQKSAGLLFFRKT